MQTPFILNLLWIGQCGNKLKAWLTETCEKLMWTCFQHIILFAACSLFLQVCFTFINTRVAVERFFAAPVWAPTYAWMLIALFSDAPPKGEEGFTDPFVE